MERLNGSIRTYVWAILGTHAQTRSNILKTGMGFDAQKQFLANIEDAITFPVDIPCSIARYQERLGYASTHFEFVCGIGLYLMPSDMAVHPGNVQGYNNEIQIAGSDAAIGHNTGINEAEPITPKAIRHSKARPPHQLGPFTRDHSLRSSSGTRQMTTARQRLTLKRIGRAGRARPAGRRWPTKKKKRPSWSLG